MEEKELYIIAIDFDGTLVEDRFPDIGDANEDTINMAKKHQKDGAKLILWTCRCGKELDAAVDFCRNKGIVFDAINRNIPEHRAKYATDSRKVYADEYWDDRAANIYAGVIQDKFCVFI